MVMIKTMIKTVEVKKKTAKNMERQETYESIKVMFLVMNKSMYKNRLDLKSITNNKKFWKTIKPFLTSEILSHFLSLVNTFNVSSKC